MKPIKLSKLLYKLYDTPLYSDPLITGLSADSRTVKPGDLFFAYKGEEADGRKFIEDAISKGAHAVLIEVQSNKTLPVHKNGNIPILPVDHLEQHVGPIAATFCGLPSQQLQAIGITGTNGKTSCSHFIAEALHYLAHPCGVVGTLGSGIYGDLLSNGFTTPPPILLQNILASFVKKKVEYVAMEVSSHSLEQGRVNGVEFAVGVFTNLSRDHLDYHGDMQAYGAAKKKLFASHVSRQAVVNLDDPFGLMLAKSLDPAHTLTYSLENPEASIYARSYQLTLEGIHTEIVTPWGTGLVSVPLIGKFNLSNLLASLGALGLVGIPFQDLLKSFSQLTPVPGRMQTFGGGAQPLIVVDYSHTPDALEKALLALRAHCKNNLLCLFGCGGDRDRGKRPEMAKIAERLADKVIVTDDNPRTEDSERIMQDIFKGFLHPEKIVMEHDRAKAIHDIIDYAKSGDCVLIAGKGAETYQLIGDQSFPFNDGEKVMEKLNARLA